MKVVLAVRPVDLRKSFNGLYAVAQQLKETPEKGALFVFSNRPRNRVKVLCFDGTGCWVSTKRLEKGTFSWPKGSDAKKEKMRLKPEALGLLLDGVDLRGGKLRAWYER
ncbi:MAG: IS66 family insertion sequence element accessory protein TnpB [Chloroflexi bacterium]|nr:IS66 family insertion sequence element accessory protein TnpB [Chloroflexota bacterium]